jgi:hypothetical protein
MQGSLLTGSSITSSSVWNLTEGACFRNLGIECLVPQLLAANHTRMVLKTGTQFCNSL